MVLWLAASCSSVGLFDSLGSSSCSACSTGLFAFDPESFFERICGSCEDLLAEEEGLLFDLADVSGGIDEIGGSVADIALEEDR
mmetsp:Transcript_9709/g.22130  ORF Transcript_9709/g.22130 Transcript_9709/m.22130 type:complete len:84 (+) Transcript_9709:400-651(+)